MAWPTPTDYTEAVQRPRVFLEDEELRGGEVGPQRRWACRCSGRAILPTSTRSIARPPATPGP